MDTKSIIQQAYSLVLFKILNEIRRDDDGGCDMEYCGKYKYDYYDHFLITYTPFSDYCNTYEMVSIFSITFYEK